MTTCLGFQDSSFIIAENTIRKIGHNTDISLYLESFKDKYWDDGTPKDYSSVVKIFENGKEVKNGTIRVNHPLYYGGIRFHQVFFGPAVRMKVSGPDGSILFEGSIPLPEYRITSSYQRPQGGFKLDSTDYFVVILGRAVNGDDPSISNNEIGLELYGKDMVPVTWAKLVKGKTQEIEGIEFTFTDNAKYSGLQVSRDPGRIFIWSASFLFISGLVTVLYFPRRQIWIAFHQFPNRSSDLLVRMVSTKGFGLETEFKNITSDLKKELHSSRGNKK
jgi:cytochrome c biogenesis protein